MGEMTVPASALYGAQTARALDNFAISGLRPQPAFVAVVDGILMLITSADTARLRRSRGRDIDAACGQLANKN